jgi:hypothetical protein
MELAGRTVSDRRALAFRLREVFTHFGLPIAVTLEDIERTAQGWNASAAFMPADRRIKPFKVHMQSEDTIAACARGLTFQFHRIDRLLIAAKAD